MHHWSPVRWWVARDTIERGIAQIDVGRRHVDLRPQRVGAVGEFPVPHAAKQVEVLGDGPVPVRRLAPGIGQGAAVLPDLVRRQLVHVRQPLADKLDGPLVELLEVVRGVVLAILPVEPEPPHVLPDRVDVLDVFLGRIRVVETQVARAAEFLRHAEIQADRLRVADVQVAVGFGGETGPHAAPFPPRRQVVGHDGADEVYGALGRHPMIVLRPGPR
jgi:hypothetical protein